ncbi:glycogen debranching protein GlgX [Brooklawnia cerclae]|uniref:Glycogen operon protein n=1 Tax=Brooklawnia cerclae TaxID=349934 RepID=A0ABX0SJ22_9ACTN|nr:alpha-amylase family glycosyl hydrolase [Brooklawnia cerclae]NIH57060.1 glycogen operon protein [Brooklawnia cerclae]
MTDQAQPPRATPVAPESWGNATWPLGATWDPERGTTSFAVFAPDAVRVLLEFYPTDIGSDASSSVDTVQDAFGIWRAELAGAAPGTFYAYRCWGRNWPNDPAWTPGSLAGFESDRDADGNHFNPNKALLDPYAREISHVPLSPRLKALGVDHGVFGTGGGDYRGSVRRTVDTGRYAPKGIVVHDQTSPGEHPRIPAQDASVYEAHVKNLTMHPSAGSLASLLAGEAGFDGVDDVPEDLRGTYAGAACLAGYLKGLGMTTIELLPVHETDSDQAGAVNGTTNHWGYMTLGFFAPNRDYASDKSPGGPTREFKQMVKAFHDAGLEVYLDVVYNHTSEGGNWDGDTDSAGFVSFGGFATTRYYDLTADGHIVDGATGSSNQTNFSSEAMCQLVLDSLHHWHHDMGVDGFRFDLATVLGRFPALSGPEDWGGRRRFFTEHPLLRDVADLADRRGFEVIAEAWDLWGYEVGNFPHGWGEWNGRFRDAMRHYLKGDGNARPFVELFNGDWLHFNDNGGPQKSINFMTAHDGFTMMDLVGFNQKSNGQSYPFGPSDGGSDSNLSWDSGGDHALRRTRWRNSWLVTLLAHGVPMVVSGDEYGRTQNGNNNPWNLNTVGVWNNWAQAVSDAPTRVAVDPGDPGAGAYYDLVGQCPTAPDVNPLFRFARFVAHLRRLDPTLRQNTWADGLPQTPDVAYLFQRPDMSGQPGPADRQLSVLVDGSSVGGTDYLVLVNMYTQPGRFVVPGQPDSLRLGLTWRRIVDTAGWAEPVCNVWAPDEAEVIAGDYVVQPWSIAVLAAIPDDSPLHTDVLAGIATGRGGRSGATTAPVPQPGT